MRIIEEEELVQPVQNIQQGKNANSKIQEKNTMNAKFKPDTGAEFYEDEINTNKIYGSPKNYMTGNTINANQGGGNKNYQNHFNFLPQISTYRGFDYNNKTKLK
jgi:hypothetical protein